MPNVDLELLDDSDFSVVDDDEEEDVFSVDDDDDEDAYEQENVVPVTKKTAATKKKAPAKKKAAVLSVQDSPAAAAPRKSSIASPTIEQKYQKKTQLEHILVRPDTYIGSTEPLTTHMHVWDASQERMVWKEITYTPGLYKIFDEIVVNAADNKQRDPDGMDRLDISLDREGNRITVRNNGQGVPVVMHKEHKVYVPTMIFGQLLTGSNFNDNEKKTTGGRNGYGAKLANIFSTEFVIECMDTKTGKKLKQTFRNNMSVTEDPIITNATAKEKKAGDYTQISFSPDLHRFQMFDGWTDDTLALLSKRAFDIAGTMAGRPGKKKLSVTLNGEKIPVKSFPDYLKLFDGMNEPVALEKVNERWEVGVTWTDGNFQQVSFANAICTSKGGGHVNYITDQIVDHLKDTVKKRNKGGTEIKKAQIRNHLCVFVNCLIENPAFDSQTKEFMTTRHKQFGSKVSLSDAFWKKVDKSEIVNTILSFARFKEKREMSRKGGTKKTKLTGIPKLDDANWAGGAKSIQCTLILTEGDSAKSLAMSGLSVVGRDAYGVFPLKGKPLNVRDATHTQLMKNAEIQNLMEIMGLKPNVHYDESNIKTLRYGRLMVMSDQDHDGSHIKGLVINIFAKMWPSLLEMEGFLCQFITPIVKATKKRGGKGKQQSKTFFTLPEYESWKEVESNKGWKIKYYKGLGTSTSAEAKEYFSNIDTHEINFQTLSQDICDDEIRPDSVGSGADMIDMVFSKSRVDERKKWLNNFTKELEQETYMDYSVAKSEGGVKYSDFVNKELILFSKSDNLRSIPHLVDGLKPSQRKVLFGCFKRKLKDEVKVAQLAGYVGEHSSYHHGEASLHGTIIAMAQSYVGANNVNLLTPSGQFGTRRMGGKDAASPRYIFTSLEKITRAIFHPDDDELLNYLNDDGMSIEPEYYVPVIPLVLVNGADGIGTGWSTLIHNYNPREIMENLRRKIRGEEMQALHPYYEGFQGEISENEKTPGKYVVKGKIERLNDTTLQISELPVKTWTQNYKEFLEAMLIGEKDKAGKSKGPAQIKDFKENHTEDTVLFTISAEKDAIDGWEKGKDGLYGKFKLLSSLTTSNMNVFDTQDRITKFDTPESIIDAFYEIRLDFYVKRKTLLMEKLGREQRMLSNKARFVEEVCSGELIVSNRKRSELLADLQERGYELFSSSSKKDNQDDSEDDEDEMETSDAELAKGYEYLLGMKIWSLTYEKAQALREQLSEKTQELETLEATSPAEIWLADLDAIEAALDERDAQKQADLQEETRARNKSQKTQRAKASKAKKMATKKKKKADEWDSDMEDSESDNNAMDVDSDIEVVAKPTRKPSIKKAASSKVATKKAPAKAKAAAAGVPTPAVAPPKRVDAPVEVDDTSLSLAERLQRKMMVSPPKLKVSAVEKVVAPAISSAMSTETEASRGQKRPSPKASFSSDESDSDVEIVATASKKKPAAKKPKKQAPTKSAPAKSKRAPLKKKKIVEDSESEDEFDFRDDSDDESIPSAKASSRTRSTRTAAKKTKSYDFESDSDVDFDGDDSDF